MKIACLLKGIFYMDHYKAKNRKIDFRQCYQSLFNFFGDNQIDYYIATYDNIYLEEIKNIYKPKALSIREYNENENNLVANNKMIQLVIDTFLEHKKEDYDIIIITRPDIKFHTYTIDKLPIDYTQNKVQLILTTHKIRDSDYFIEDNFIIMKENHLLNYKKNIDKKIKWSQHNILRRFQYNNKSVCNFYFTNSRIANTPFYYLSIVSNKK